MLCVLSIVPCLGMACQDGMAVTKRFTFRSGVRPARSDGKSASILFSSSFSRDGMATLRWTSCLSFLQACLLNEAATLGAPPWNGPAALQDTLICYSLPKVGMFIHITTRIFASPPLRWIIFRAVPFPGRDARRHGDRCCHRVAVHCR